MKEYASQFYKSQAWKKTAAAYAKAQRNLCELCWDQGQITPGEMVHHKIFLTPENIADPSISLNWNNLQLVCRKHHAMLHGNRKRYSVDAVGHVTGYDTPPHSE